MLWRISQVCSSFGAGYRSFQSLRQCVPQFRAQLLRDKKVSLPETRSVDHAGGGKWRPPVSLKLVVVGLAGLRLCSCTLKVSCQASAADGAAGTRLVGVAKYVHEPKFDWRRFLALLWPHAWYLLGAIVSALAVALMNIQIPQLLGGIIDVMAKFTGGLGSKKFMQDMKEPVTQLLYFYVAQSVFTFLYIHLLSCVGERIATTMREDLFASIMKQDIAFFDHQKTGELVNRLTIDIQDFKSCFKQCISQGLRSIAQITGCAVSLFIISPQMTLGMLVVVPSIIVTGTLLGSVLRKMSRRAQEQTSKATAISDEAIGNIRTVRAFAMEAKECELFNKEIEEARKLNEALGFGVGLFQGGTNLFLNGMVLGTLYAGGYLLSIQQVSAGDLMAFLVATQTIQRSLTQLSLLFGQMVRGMASGARVYEFINFRPRIPLTGGKTIPYHSLQGHIKFQDVTFAYPTRPTQNILRHFSLELPPGKTLAIVGSSGNGKSTVAALLERFYDVNEGSITVDGIEIRNLDPSWLRGKAIGFINQEPILFATSVMENIRYGRPDATDEEVRMAAKLANADGFIRQFPRGYSTVLGERGVTVSGGQKQRIAIARALLKNPAILILDEATSALDASSEQAVQSALDNATRGRTVLVIAHRLSTIQKADLIVVLDNGVIVETGTHDSLVKRRGLYWNLIKQQRENDAGSRAEG